jgi:glycosyltransferase involved in cell wall biosynthesis
MSRRRPLLLVAHDAGRGEMPLFVLRFVRWLHQHDHDVRVLLWRGGPLLSELRTLAPVEVVDDLNRWWFARLLQVVGLRAVAARVKGLRLRLSLRLLARGRTVLVVGAEAGRAVGYLGGGGAVVTSLPGGRRSLDALSPADRAALLARSDGVLVRDEAAVAELAGHDEVPADRLRVVPPSMPLPAASSSPGGARRRLGIPEDAVVVAGTGTDDWWRAPDPFVVVAWQLRHRRPDLPLHFLWACADDDEDGLWPLRHDVENAGLTERFHLATDPPAADDLVAADVLVVATREESLRQVALDVALAARPVVVSAAGDVAAALGEGAVVVPPLDLDGAVEAVLALLDDPARAAALALAAHQHLGWARDAAESAPQALLDAVDELAG